MIRLGALLIIFICSSVFVFAQDKEFDYLNIEGNEISTTHLAKYTITIDGAYRYLGEFRHQPTYGDKQFNVSMVVYIDGQRLFMVHAEKHTDGSGGLDYSQFRPALLHEASFNLRELCAPEEAEEELSVNPEIRFIRDSGFDLSLPFYLSQYMATSEDGTSEVVISMGRKIDSCDEIPAEFKLNIENDFIEEVFVKNDAESFP